MTLSPSDRQEFAGVWYRRGRAFYADHCCKLHPNYTRRIVGYELHREVADEQ